MTYGTIKVDTITFTDGGVDKSVSISGLVQNPTFSGNITVTGTVSGNTIRGQTVSGVTVTGTTALFSTGTFISLTGTTSQGTTATYTSGSFTSLTGVTTSGTTANFVSGVFSTQISGATVTGNAGAFTTLTGGVTTVTSGVFAVGSESNPSISFTSDLNTGIYSPGADQVAISTGGSGRLFVDASGNVGVSATPTSLGTSVRTLEIKGAATNRSGGLSLTSSDNSANAFFYTFDNVSYLGTTATPLSFFTNNTERLRITAAGLVGVGTSSPDRNLTIANAGGNATANILASTTGESVFYFADSTTGTGAYAGYLQYLHSTDNLIIGCNAGEAIRIDSSRRVGIGTSSPGSNLDVRFGTSPATDNGGGDNTLRVWTSSALAVNTGGAISFGGIYNSSNNDAAAFAQIAGRKENATSGDLWGYLQFATNTGGGTMVERMRITGTGNVGIGTTSPNVNLEVASTTPTARINATGGGTPQLSLFSAGVYDWVIQGGTALKFIMDVTERARIDSAGRLLVGTSTSIASDSKLQVKDGAIHIYHANSAASAGYDLRFSTDGGATARTQAAIGCLQATPNQSGGILTFSTTADGASSPTERMRITNAGDIYIAQTTTSIPGAGNTTVGIGLNSVGLVSASRTGGIVGTYNRNGSDGTLVGFYQDGNLEGDISVSGTTVSYNGAHLSRWSQLPSGAERIEILRGSVLSNIDEMCEWGEEDNEQLNRMKVSDVEGDKNVSGVFQAWDDDDDTYTNDFYCAMTGDFIIRIGAGVIVERGDLLMSAGDGTAKPQDDDIIRSKTVAKVTSTNVSCTYDDGSYCVPCVLMAC